MVKFTEAIGESTHGLESGEDRHGSGAPGCTLGQARAHGCSLRKRLLGGRRPGMQRHGRRGTRRRRGAEARRGVTSGSVGRPASSAAMAAVRRRSRSFTCTRSWDTASDSMATSSSSCAPTASSCSSSPSTAPSASPSRSLRVPRIGSTDAVSATPNPPVGSRGGAAPGSQRPASREEARRRESRAPPGRRGRPGRADLTGAVGEPRGRWWRHWRKGKAPGGEEAASRRSHGE